MNQDHSTPPLLLGVNIDHAATLRQARYRGETSTCGGFIEPDPLAVALAAEEAGADGITIHLREDRRHIQDEDVRRIREGIASRLNLEMAATREMALVAGRIRPEAVCLVPESREEVTTEGGLDVAGQPERIREIIGQLAPLGIEVSLFIDPDPDQISAAIAVGAPVVELHTGAFARAWSRPEYEAELRRLRLASTEAHHGGLVVNAGHGINYHNIRAIRSVPHLHELNIGHAILSRALLTGIREAVREMKARMRQ